MKAIEIGTSRKSHVQVSQEQDGTVLVRFEAAPEAAPAGDEPIAVSSVEARYGIERGALQPYFRSGDLPVAKIGRSLFVKKSDLLRLVDLLAVRRPKNPTPPGVDLDDDYAALAATGRK